jgi:hypothetical protein
MRSATSASLPMMAMSAGPAGAITRQLAVDHEHLGRALQGGGSIVRDAHRKGRDDARGVTTDLLGGGPQGGNRVVLQGLRTRAPRERAVGQRRGDLQHLLAECGDHDVGSRTTRHCNTTVHAELLTGVRHRLALQQRHHHFQVLAHVTNRLVETHAPHGLHHDLVTETDAEAQTTVRCRVHREGLLSHHHRVTWVRGNDAGSQLDAGHLATDHGQRRQRVVSEDLRRPVAGETGGLGRSSLGHHGVDRSVVRCSTEDSNSHGPTVTAPTTPIGTEPADDELRRG